MKLTTGILVAGLMTGGVWAQNPNVINKVQGTTTVQQQNTNDSNAAVGITGSTAGTPAKPAASVQTQPAARSPMSAPGKVASAPGPFRAPAPVTKHSAGRHPVIVAAETPNSEGKRVVPTAKAADASNNSSAAKAAKPEEKKWSMTGKRDPFFSPVVQQVSASGCSTGKKCLEIGQINLRGVVKSEDGFIAVVTNSLNKAYFLREKDPVFNGYVVRITGDAVVFQETVQDKLGKPLTREVTKRIITPAV
jgi:Tfp pilus assembly protein PilP